MPQISVAYISMPQISVANTSMTRVSPFENGRNEKIMSFMEITKSKTVLCGIFVGHTQLNGLKVKRLE